MLYQENAPKSYKDIIFNIIIYIVFIVYILLLIKIILFKDASFNQILYWDVASYSSTNFIPFKGIYDYIFNIDMNGLRIFANVFGNFGIFLPLGYLLPLMFPKMRSVKMILLSSAIITLIFETMQYVFCLGSTDIDDLILNVAGAIAGYGFFCLFKKLFSKKRSFYFATIVLIIAAGSIMSFIIWEEFSDLIGVNRYEQEYVGKEKIPERSADHNGTLEKRNENTLSIYPNNIVTADSQIKELYDTVEININKDTKFYSLETEQISKWKTLITYKPITWDDLKDIEAYSGIEVWLTDTTGQTAETVVFSDPVEGDVSVSGQDMEIEGDVVSISDDIIDITLTISYETEDAGMFSQTTDKIIRIKLDDQVTYSYVLMSETEIIEERTGHKKDIVEGSSIDITGEIEGDFVKAKSITIYAFTY